MPRVPQWALRGGASVIRRLRTETIAQAPASRRLSGDERPERHRIVRVAITDRGRFPTGRPADGGARGHDGRPFARIGQTRGKTPIATTAHERALAHGQ